MSVENKKVNSSRSLGSKAPWPIILLFFLTTIFFLAGFKFDLKASEINIKISDLLCDKTGIQGDSSQQSTPPCGMPYDEKTTNIIVEFERDRASKLSESAKTAYDFAKIALGALLTCITQMISSVVQRGNRHDGIPPNDIPSEDKVDKG